MKRRKLFIWGGHAWYVIAQRWEKKREGGTGESHYRGRMRKKDLGSKWRFDKETSRAERRTSRCGRKMCGGRRRQRDTGRDQYGRVMIGSLRGSGGTALSDIRDQSVCVRVHRVWFLLLCTVFRNMRRLGFSCCMQNVRCMCDETDMSDVGSTVSKQFNFEFRNY